MAVSSGKQLRFIKLLERQRHPLTVNPTLQFRCRSFGDLVNCAPAITRAPDKRCLPIQTMRAMSRQIVDQQLLSGLGSYQLFTARQRAVTFDCKIPGHDFTGLVVHFL